MQPDLNGVENILNGVPSYPGEEVCMRAHVCVYQRSRELCQWHRCQRNYPHPPGLGLCRRLVTFHIKNTITHQLQN